MTEAEVQKLRDAGISDAVIISLQKEEGGKDSPIQAPASDLPEIDPNSPSKVYTDAKAAGVPTEGRPQTFLQTATELLPAVAPYAAPAALAAAGGGGAYGLYIFGSKALDVGRGVNEQMAQRNKIEAARETRMSNRPGFGGVPKTAPAISGTPNFGAGAPGTAMPTAPYQVPTAGPVVPQAPAVPQGMAPTQAAQPGMMQRGMDMANQVRQAAAQRIMPAMGQAGQAISQAGSMFGRGLSAAAPALRVGGIVSNALYSGDLNADEQAELERRRKMQPTITR